jgi:transcriptional regulator with XRE-family HTH domain
MTRHYLLRSARVREIIDERHLTHATVARRLGVARAYWSQLVNRKRPLTATTRRLILDSTIFAGIAEAELWDRIEVPDAPPGDDPAPAAAA